MAAHWLWVVQRQRHNSGQINCWRVQYIHSAAISQT